MAEPVLRVEQLSKRYGAGESGAEIPVLKNVTFTVAPGESVAITGPSGCGKSTLLQIIGALDHPTSGKVWLEEKNLADLGETELAAIRNEKVGFVFQAHHLLPQCTALENVLIPALARRNKVPEDLIERGRNLLNRVGLAQRFDQPAARLSGGEAQRVALVRALINSPRLLLADEPTGSLDAASAKSIADLLRQLNREEKVALVVATHSPELAGEMSRMLRLREGVLESGS